MKKTLIAAALAATTLLTSHAGAYELRDYFVGANGGTRTITGMVLDGDVTTFTIETTNRRGITKTKEFTATYNGDGFDVSGNGQQLFKDFLAAHALNARGLDRDVANESQDLNRLAYDAWREHQIDRYEAAGLGDFAESIRSIRYQIEFDFIGRADDLGIDWRPNQAIDFVSALAQSTTTTVNQYGTYQSNRINTVVRDSDAVCHIGFDGTFCDAPHDIGKTFKIESDDITSIMKNADGTVTIEAMAAPSVYLESRWGPANWYLTSLDKTEEVTINATLNSAVSRLTVDALEAHASGITGEGIKVGVFDVPNDMTGYRSRSYARHGEHSDDIIKAFAPGAETTRVFYDHPGSDWLDFGVDTLARSWEQLNELDIVNYSHGPAAGNDRAAAVYQTYYSRYSENLKDDLLIVAAAGNEGHDSMVRELANGAAVVLVEDRPDTTIIVGALNHAGDGLASYSNRAGYLKDNYLATVAIPFPESVNDQGTSFAAPVVSAAAALVKQKFGTNAAETANILFSTADDLGVAGVDDVYGHGALNLGRALTPVGGLN